MEKEEKEDRTREEERKEDRRRERKKKDKPIFFCFLVCRQLSFFSLPLLTIYMKTSAVFCLAFAKSKLLNFGGKTIKDLTEIRASQAPTLLHLPAIYQGQAGQFARAKSFSFCVLKGTRKFFWGFHCMNTCKFNLNRNTRGYCLEL